MAKQVKYVFSLPKSRLDVTKKPNELINGVYSFKDGKLEANEKDGPLLERILCQYYGCKVERVETGSDEPAGDASTSLAKSVTAPPAGASAAPPKG